MLFCADLKKFQSLKEGACFNQLTKEDEKEEKSRKHKIKRELEGHGLNIKSEYQKKTKVCVKEERTL